MVDDPYRVRRIHINNHPKPVKRDEKNRIEREFDINGKKIMAYSRKDAIKRLKHMLMLVFSFLLKGAPACEGMRSLYLYNA